MASIYDLLPTFNYIEVNNLKGLQPGFVVAQMEVADSAKATLLVDNKFFENGKICAISANGIVAGTADDKALFIHYTEPLNTVANSDKYFAVDVDEECPRLVQLIPGDEWMSTEKLEEDEDENQNKIGILGGRIVEITGQDGWYGVTTMANGDTGYHYMFLG